MQITSDQTEYNFSKQLMLVMLKKRLYLRRFLASFVNFCITTAFEIFCELFLNFWMTTPRIFIVEPTFCERYKNHKFDNFKTHKNLFFDEVLHCIKSACVSMYSV